ncbi:MAG TPA: hypothetical protein VMG80_00620, partial [Solirubrobacteraceae bacterium]|nr:hypothetical protein [Solirubrobacteraceae bacterium]
MSRAVRIGVIVFAVAAILVALVQLIGPAVAAKVVEQKVDRYGIVNNVTVKAWPAVKLLWREADEVDVDAGTLTMSPEQAVSLLGEGKGTSTVHARARVVVLGGLRLTNVGFDKNGSELKAEGTVSEPDIAKV